MGVTCEVDHDHMHTAKRGLPSRWYLSMRIYGKMRENKKCPRHRNLGHDKKIGQTDDYER
jgi:hypothetical protein